MVAVNSTLIELKRWRIFRLQRSQEKKRWCKAHVGVRGKGLPLSFMLSPGNEHDSKRFVEVLNGIKIRKGIGRPKSRPVEVLRMLLMTTKKYDCISDEET